MKKVSLFFAMLLMASSSIMFSSCEDEYDDIETRKENLNKDIFEFPQEGGTELLYVIGRKTLNLTSALVEDSHGNVLADVSLTGDKKQKGVKSNDGILYGHVEYDENDRVKEIRISEFTVTLIYDKKGHSTNVYRIEARPATESYNKLILSVNRRNSVYITYQNHANG